MKITLHTNPLCFISTGKYSMSDDVMGEYKKEFGLVYLDYVKLSSDKRATSRHVLSYNEKWLYSIRATRNTE